MARPLIPTVPHNQAHFVQEDTRVTVSAGTAFKIGVFAALGAFAVGLVVWLILGVLMVGAISSAFHR
jgi:hypothetical protein